MNRENVPNMGISRVGNLESQSYLIAISLQYRVILAFQQRTISTCFPHPSTRLCAFLASIGAPLQAHLFNPLTRLLQVCQHDFRAMAAPVAQEGKCEISAANLDVSKLSEVTDLRRATHTRGRYQVRA